MAPDPRCAALAAAKTKKGEYYVSIRPPILSYTRGKGDIGICTDNLSFPTLSLRIVLPSNRCSDWLS